MFLSQDRWVEIPVPQAFVNILVQGLLQVPSRTPRRIPEKLRTIPSFRRKFRRIWTDEKQSRGEAERRGRLEEIR
jgi:hypothetical protein